jgi:Mu transposase, C-terminal
MRGKAIVERTFESINTLFCQQLAGYTGRDTTRRGPDVAEEAIWTVAQLQELFDEWAIAWQNRPHEGLSHTWGQGRDLSPNEMYAACVGISGYVPLPLSGDDYIELLPVVFRTVNDYGLTIDNRTYDCKALNPYRRLDSGLPGGNRKRWEVHYDPYDITVVWLRDHRANKWVIVPWVYRSLAGQPFGLALWEHTRRMTTERSGPRPTEADIARNIADLLRRARGQDLTMEEAKVIAVEANRPVRPHADSPEDPTDVPEAEDEPSEQPEPSAAGSQDAYEVFNPEAMPWRL